MDKNKEVASISGFMDWVKDSLPDENEQPRRAFFYRGHADENYRLLPSIYRTNGEGKSHRDDESLMYHEMLRREPLVFSSDVTVFERLARMQHHGLPTRLLDLTQSPLIALFFACESKPEKNGQVMFFHCAQRDVLHQQTLPGLVLAGVEHPLTFSSIGYDVCKDLCWKLKNESYLKSGNSEFDKDINDFISGMAARIDEGINEEMDFLRACGILIEFDRIISGFREKWVGNFNQRIHEIQEGAVVNELSGTGKEHELLNVFRVKEFFLDLLDRFDKWQVQMIVGLCEKVHVEYTRDWRSLGEILRRQTYFYFVFAPLNNERIRRQRGAFLVCPPAKTDYWRVENVQTPVTVQIKAEAKETLLKDLANHGITRSYLFPELEEQARDIRSLYPPS